MGGPGKSAKMSWQKIWEILKSIRELLYVLNRDNEITGTPILKILSFKKIHTEMAAYVVM